MPKADEIFFFYTEYKQCRRMAHELDCSILDVTDTVKAILVLLKTSPHFTLQPG
jgi:hypothetical protein